MRKAEYIFSIEVDSCLIEQLKDMSVSQELRINDYEFLVDRIHEISARLSVKRKEAIAEDDGVPARARINPSSIPQVTGLIARSLELEERELENQEKFYTAVNGAMISGRKLEPKIPFDDQRRNFDERRLKYAVSQEQSRVASAYGNAIRDEVATLRKLEWP